MKFYPAKAPVAAGVSLKRRFEFLASEIGPQHIKKHVLGIGCLPQQEVRCALLPARSDDQIDIGHVRGVEPDTEALGIDGCRIEFTIPGRLSDPDHQLADALGVYGEHQVKDFKYTGLSRDTFLIDPEGKVARAFRQVDPERTSQDTYEAVMQAKGG